VFDWSDVNDPTGTFIFTEGAWDLIKANWDPVEIQQKIEGQGVVTMVREINEWSRSQGQFSPLKIQNIGWQKTVMSREEYISRAE